MFSQRKNETSEKRRPVDLENFQSPVSFEKFSRFLKFFMRIAMKIF